MAHAAQIIRNRIDRHFDEIGAIDELSDARYHATHERFEAASNQRDLIIDWLRDLADRAALPDHRPARLLSVGCGDGAMDQRITGVFAGHADSLALVGVDPNPRHTEAFERLFAGEGFEVEAFTGTFEAFRSERLFDIIHLIHCLYYFESIEPELQKAVDMLAPGGSLVVLQAPNDELNHLADRVWRKQFDQSAWYSHDVLDALAPMGVELRVHRIEAEVDVTECFDPESEAGTEILDFIVQADTRQFPAPFQSWLRESLRSICRRQGRRLLAEHPVDAIVARKPREG